MSVEVVKRHFTIEEYYRIAAAGVLREDDRVELIEGEILQLNPIGPLHAGTVNHLVGLLARAVGRLAVVSVQNPLHTDVFGEPQPDLMLLRFRDDDYYGKTPTSDDVLLLVEVADSSLRVDRSVKLPLYAKHGIPEVWIVNLVDKLVEVCRDPGPDGYRSVTPVGRGASL